MRRCLLLLAACVAVSSAVPAYAQTVLFSAEMADSAGWTYSHFGGSGPPASSDSAEADFNWDYSQFGIPEAPHTAPGDASQRGLRLAANIPGIFGGDAIGAVYEDSSFAGQYTVQVDMWLNWAADPLNIGTTEHAGVYVGFDSDDVNNFLLPAQNGAGLLIDTDGDCTNCDYILAKDAAELDTFSGQYSVRDFGFGNQPGYDNTDVNEDPANGDLINIPELFPSFDIGQATNNMNGEGTQAAGALGFQWVTMTIEVDANAPGMGSNGSVGTARFSVRSANSGNSLYVGTVDNSVDDILDDDMDGDECDATDGSEDICTGEQPVGLEGGISLMMIDFFGGNPSTQEFGFVVYDNVRVFEGLLTDVNCDFDSDGMCGIDDLNLMLAEGPIAGGVAVTPGVNDQFDLNGDNVIDLADRDMWLSEAATENGLGSSYQIGDANLDGSVDVTDFNSWNGGKFTSTLRWDNGDFNGDGSADVSDFNSWNGNKFTSSDGVASVPEPAAALLLFWGLKCFLWLRRR